MDPFTEKLLERTRARRENLQKKMAERPNAANRQMVKRPREPLTDTNSLICEPPLEKIPQAAPKPSPSKRKCSGENLQSSIVDEENKEPTVPKSVTPLLQDPPTDKKPPVGPASIRNTPSMERRSRPNVPTQEDKTESVEPKRKAVVEEERVEMVEVMEVSQVSSLQNSRSEEVGESAGPSATGMRSRLQMLADQRKCWESGNPTAAPDCPPLSMLKRQPEVTPSPAPSSVSAGPPLGRRGRLANLAATIGSWEDDLSHASIPKQEKPNTASVPKMLTRDTNGSAKSTAHVVTSSAALDKSAAKSNQSMIHSPVKATQVTPPSPQKAEAPAVPSTNSPQKLSKQELSFASTPLKERLQPAAQSTVKTPLSSRTLGVLPSPNKPDIRPKPADQLSLIHI